MKTYMLDSDEFRDFEKEERDRVHNQMTKTCRYITNPIVEANYEANPEENEFMAFQQSMECEILLSLNEFELDAVATPLPSTITSRMYLMDRYKKILLDLDKEKILLEKNLKTINNRITSYNELWDITNKQYLELLNNLDG